MRRDTTTKTCDDARERGWLPGSRDADVALRAVLPAAAIEIAQVLLVDVAEHAKQVVDFVAKPVDPSGFCRADVVIPQSLEFARELQGELHPGQIEAALLDKELDLPELLDVAVGVQAKVARRPGRGDESLTLVFPQGLRMHFDEPGRNADDKQGF